MSFIWVAVSFDYYLVGFELKYLPGDIYVNGLASSISDNVAYVVSGLMYAKIGWKWSGASMFSLSTVGGLLIIFWGFRTPY